MEIKRETNIKELKHFSTGKVREIYEIDDDKLLIITTDRISAFDVIMDDPIPQKGVVLTQVANFWFDKFSDVVKNHIISTDPVKDFPILEPYKEYLEGRSIVVHRCKPLPIEAIVRGYLAGSGLKEYNRSQTVCGIELPKGLVNSSKLPEPIFTPSTKAEQGLHDENISYEKMVEIIGKDLSEKIKEISLKLYKEASEFARTKGIIIADTKFEFGIYNGELLLIDEVLTPDSSRFWPLDDYEEGRGQKSFDKQYLRDYLENLTKEGKWNKDFPAPALPLDVLKVTSEKYRQAFDMLKK
ncbi:MAG: phosphoribosylaminoimidazolesuccinocarboxamide synthase [Candidatus Cloacimonadota bacterium]|nr:MAG: phosphoribosylaminoimidazolesuccinocarboxamide synthase [Candidatus Cloacimonadota bacterium]PIE82025.1 MAG: phosphoribosylaminoimidazolesuccinocarboxamide synthase [Candidatus Delongbacteria bacterium]